MHPLAPHNPPRRPQVHNEGGSKRVVVTKDLPGDRWKQILLAANCRVEVCTSPDTILSNATIKKLMGDKCDGVIGQLTEVCSVAVCIEGVCGHVHVPACRLRGQHPACSWRGGPAAGHVAPAGHTAHLLATDPPPLPSSNPRTGALSCLRR